MTTPHHSQSKEQPSTYFVQDRSSAEELERLQLQDHMLTTAMGGVLPEQSDPHRFQRVLDVGCGPGGWLIELGQAYPDGDALIGVDISRRMVEYARKHAYDARHVFRSGPPFSLLRPSVEEGADLDAFADIEEPDAFRAIELVAAGA